MEPTSSSVRKPTGNSGYRIGQLVKLVSERTPGTLLSNTKVNLREHVNAILVRFGEEKSCVEKERRSSDTLDSKSLESSQEEKNEKPAIVEYKSKIPYSVALVRDRSQGNMRKFIEIFKKLKINLSLCDLLL
ncbi:hypothetical protein M9H77_04362 [Catharanthus roseus]|uniref:Uncharacterized protein n=1 Tax=Catharanthus roseus TaxID=4058 RepID=A0ACC0CDV9_CATRO|nr:hypothetical protein M9H77_04362 [Catharanthus roseus]